MGLWKSRFSLIQAHGATPPGRCAKTRGGYNYLSRKSAVTRPAPPPIRRRRVGLRFVAIEVARCNRFAASRIGPGRTIDREAWKPNRGPGWASGLLRRAESAEENSQIFMEGELSAMDSQMRDGRRLGTIACLLTVVAMLSMTGCSLTGSSQSTPGLVSKQPPSLAGLLDTSPLLATVRSGPGRSAESAARGDSVPLDGAAGENGHERRSSGRRRRRSDTRRNHPLAPGGQRRSAG